MNKREVSIKEATEKWVNTFDAIPLPLIERAFRNELHNWIELTPESEEDENCYDSIFPRWEYLWLISNSCDEEWILNNLETVKNLGFRIFQDYVDEYTFLGIDGSKYDFFIEHWIPLYKARGLKWHRI